MTQLALFDSLQEKSVSLNHVASQLEVSVASVRNWIKTGYLVPASRGMVSMDSFDNFQKKVAGGEKLTARANKSLKDSHNHEEVLKKYHSLIHNNEVNATDLGVRYEEALSNSYRNKEGVYYTPSDVVEVFFQYLPKDCSDLSFCDPCCGSGNFIVAAIEWGISPENIHGYDIDSFAVELTKKRIFELTGYKTNTIQRNDFLESSLQYNKRYFDLIFTNPPWGKKIHKSQKELYARAVGSGKSMDTSSLFFFACLARLTKGGCLGFLLQDAFFNISSYEDARKKALELQILSIIDFGKPFKGLVTKAKGIVIKNTQQNEKNFVACSRLVTRHERLQNSFSNNPKSIFNATASQEESDVISHLYTLPHKKLLGHAKWGLGIVTGNNKKFIKEFSTEGYVAAYKGADIQKNKINKATSYIPEDLSLYQQVAPIALYQANEKLIYKFISSNLVFFCDTKQRYVLNSANMLIPDADFPINQLKLCQIFNSKLMNWLFKTIFDTHKVLRSDIESLPIHTGYFIDHPTFEEQTFHTYLNVEESKDGTFRIKK